MEGVSVFVALKEEGDSHAWNFRNCLNFRNISKFCILLSCLYIFLQWSWFYKTIYAVASYTQFEKHDNKCNPISWRPLTQNCSLLRKLRFLWSGFHLGFSESEKVSWVTSFAISSLSLTRRVVVFCISSFLVQYIWWNTSLIFYLRFPEVTSPCLFSKASVRSFPVFFASMLFPQLCFCSAAHLWPLLPHSITSLSYPSLSSPLNSHPLIFRGLLDNRTKTFRVTLTSPVPCIVPGVVSTNKYLLNKLITCISFPFKPASFSNFHLLSLVSLFLSLSTTANIWFFFFWNISMLVLFIVFSWLLPSGRPSSPHARITPTVSHLASLLLICPLSKPFLP